MRTAPNGLPGASQGPLALQPPLGPQDPARDTIHLPFQGQGLSTPPPSPEVPSQPRGHGPCLHLLCVGAPGAATGWCDCVTATPCWAGAPPAHSSHPPGQRQQGSQRPWALQCGARRAREPGAESRPQASEWLMPCLPGQGLRPDGAPLAVLTPGPMSRPRVAAAHAFGTREPGRHLSSE